MQEGCKKKKEGGKEKEKGKGRAKSEEGWTLFIDSNEKVAVGG